MKVAQVALGLSAAMLALAPVAALADGWTAVKLHGAVLVSQDGKWIRLKLNDTIANDQAVKTLSSGGVQFARNGETVEVLGDSQIAIHDQAGMGSTVVKEDFGTITVEDNETVVPHFTVDTPYMAAVVKGTIFTVTTRNGLSRTSVKRGKVEVDDFKSKLHVLILPGQYATSGVNTALTTKGAGTLEPIFNPSGKVVPSANAANGQAHAALGSANSANSNAGGNGKGDPGSANSNAGGNGKGNPGSANSNAEGNGNGNGNSGNASSNAGGHGKGKNG